MKKKYTIIYSVLFQAGVHWNSLTHFARVETDDLPKVLNEEFCDDSVWFVFEGWPKLDVDWMNVHFGVDESHLPSE
jgi:hypothetical protein